MSIDIKTAEGPEEWDSLVEKSPHSTLFHTWKFLKIMEKHTNSKLYPIIGSRGTTPIGVYPLFSQKRNLFTLVFSPPPKTGLLYLGPLILDYNELKQGKRENYLINFQNEIDEFISSEIKANYIRIRSPPNLPDSRQFLWSGYKVDIFYTYILDISQDSGHVWEQLNSQLRKDIKKTERENVSVEEGSKQELRFLHDSLHKRLEEQGLKSNITKEYLDEVFNSFYPRNLRIFVAKYKGENIGGLILTTYKNKVSLWIGIPKIGLEGLYPNDMAQWEAIKWACENGFKQYEIMDSGDDPRLRHSKSKFNPKPVVWFSASKYPSPVLRGLGGIRRFMMHSG